VSHINTSRLNPVASVGSIGNIILPVQRIKHRRLKSTTSAATALNTNFLKKNQSQATNPYSDKKSIRKAIPARDYQNSVLGSDKNDSQYASVIAGIKN
jgi:hypothetical protein